MALPLLLTLLVGAVDAPITDVTVYSDRARVTRVAAVAVTGTQTLELCTLLDSADLSSLRVEATGAEVVRVETPRLNDDELPIDAVRALLTDIEKLDDDLAKLNGDRQAYAAQEAALRRLQPQVPAGDPLKAPAKLSPAGWSSAITFTTAALEKAQARLRELDEAIRVDNEKRETLVQKAIELGGARRRQGSRVMATLTGNGTAKITVIYFVAGARWSPRYDVQLQPDTGKVLLSFSGLVSQTTGEDWNDAQLQLSTAIPSNSTVFPRFSTWKIGLKERFIPTPTPMSEQTPPAPVAPPLPVVRAEADGLRNRLARAVGMQADALAGEEQPVERPVTTPKTPMREQRQYPKSLAAEKSEARAGNAPAAPPPPPQAMDMSESVQVTGAVASSFRFASDEPAPRQVGFSLSPPPGWSPPALPPDAAAAAAGGYDLTWPSLQKETVPSNTGARRVALFAQTWPVTTERKIYPALFPEAFLVAELKNPSPTPLPAGVASLYVGDDPAGSATLKLVSPGETFTLPLGIDRAIRPVRNVKVVDSELGLISKDDLSEYTVTIELTNPYKAPITLRIGDQYPVTDSKDVEIKLLETKPNAAQDKVRGSLEWRLTVAAGQKQVVTYRYSIKRPKGWRMNQWEEQP